MLASKKPAASRVALANATAGSSAAFAAAILLFPLNVLKVRTAAGLPTDFSAILDAGRRGALGKASTSAVSKFCYFYCYQYLLDAYTRRQKAKRGIGTLARLAVGYLAGVGGSFVTQPLEATTVMVQTQSKRDDGAPALSWFGAFAALARSPEGPLRAFYKGLAPSLVLCINPAITYTVFEQLKARLLARRRRSAMTVAEAFWVGAFAKALATVITYPYIRAKVLLQRKRPAGGEGGDGYDARSATGVLRQVLAREGVRGAYRGLRPQLIKGVTNAALMLMLKERISGAVRSRILGR